MQNRSYTFLSFLLLLTACASPPPPTSTLAPFPTHALPTSTSTPPASVLAGTPVPLPKTAITIDNVNQLFLLARWGKGNIVQVEISPDGRMTAVATPLGIYLYDSETFAETRFIEAKNWLNSIVFSPDGTLLAAGSLDGTAQVLQVSDGSTQKTLKGPLSSITSLAFSTDGSLLAVGDADGSIYVFELTTQALRVLAGHTARIHSLIFSPDGKTLISGSEDLTVRFWQISTGVLQRTLTVKSKSLDAVALSHDGQVLATGS